MADELTFEVDTTEWQAALQEYAEVSTKDHAHSVNRCVNNLMIKGAQAADVASAAQIQALEMRFKEWWPKLVAKVIVKQKGARRAARGTKRARTLPWYKREPGSHRSEYAARVSKKMLKRRVNAITFTRGFFIKLSKALREAVPSLGGSGGVNAKSFQDIQVTLKPATPEDLNIDYRSAYTYKKRGARVVAGMQSILNRCMAAAQPAAIADMQQYIDRKAEERARQYSAI